MLKCGTDFSILMCSLGFLLADGASWYAHTHFHCVSLSLADTPHDAHRQTRAHTDMVVQHLLTVSRKGGRPDFNWVSVLQCVQSLWVCMRVMGDEEGQLSITVGLIGLRAQECWCGLDAEERVSFSFTLSSVYILCTFPDHLKPQLSHDKFASPHTPYFQTDFRHFLLFFYLNLISTAALVQLQKALIEFNCIYLVPNQNNYCLKALHIVR